MSRCCFLIVLSITCTFLNFGSALSIARDDCNDICNSFQLPQQCSAVCGHMDALLELETIMLDTCTAGGVAETSCLEWVKADTTRLALFIEDVDRLFRRARNHQKAVKIAQSDLKDIIAFGEITLPYSGLAAEDILYPSDCLCDEGTASIEAMFEFGMLEGESHTIVGAFCPECGTFGDPFLPKPQVLRYNVHVLWGTYEIPRCEVVRKHRQLVYLPCDRHVKFVLRNADDPQSTDPVRVGDRVFMYTADGRPVEFTTYSEPTKIVRGVVRTTRTVVQSFHLFPEGVVREGEILMTPTERVPLKLGDIVSVRHGHSVPRKEFKGLVFKTKFADPLEEYGMFDEDY